MRWKHLSTENSPIEVRSNMNDSRRPGPGSQRSPSQAENLQTYIIGNRTSPKANIVIYSNVFDLSLPKIIADTYAQNDNYLACLPDFFQGDSVKLKVADLLRTYAIRAGLESDGIENDDKKMTLIDAVVGLHPSHLVVPGDGEKSVVPMSSGGLKKILQ
ncbi:hypothetical protein EG328_002836 [Venturia inaequalis]|nr:hypothetical protein EG328_002836 [Venturia inaequalis]RDI83141.1 hypothetical protein Vi05172_g6856 [Venturia inaequalis]